MHLLVSSSSTQILDMFYNLLRMIVLAEILQNSWSFSLMSNSLPRSTATKLKQARWDQLGMPWRKTKSRDHSDEHVLEDIFLEEITHATIGHHDGDDEYHFPDSKYQLDEVVESLDTKESEGDKEEEWSP